MEIQIRDKAWSEYADRLIGQFHIDLEARRNADLLQQNRRALEGELERTKKRLKDLAKEKKNKGGKNKKDEQDAKSARVREKERNLKRLLKELK